MTELVKYDQACRLIAESKSFDEVSNIREKAEAMRAYARMAKNRDLELNAAEIRIRAERRLGQMLLVLKTEVGLPKGGRPSKVDNRQPTLAEMGIDRKLSSRTQRLARLTDKDFTKQIAAWREHSSYSTSVAVELNPRLTPARAKAIDAGDHPYEFKLIDGRMVGDIGLSELQQLAEIRSAEARLLRALFDHFATIDPTLAVREAVKAGSVAAMIADAFEVRS